MEYVYAVCAPSSIDGGAPGYFAICITKTERDAHMMLDYFNKILFRDTGHDIEDFICENDFEFGYEEGIRWDYYDRRDTLYVRKIPIIPDASNGIKLFDEYIKKRIDRQIQAKRKYLEKVQQKEEQEKVRQREQERIDKRINELIRLKNIQAMEGYDED